MTGRGKWVERGDA